LITSKESVRRDWIRLWIKVSLQFTFTNRSFQFVSTNWTWFISYRLFCNFTLCV